MAQRVVHSVAQVLTPDCVSLFLSDGFRAYLTALLNQLSLFQTYHNFSLPHASVRKPLPKPAPTNGTGSAKQWRPCTPAMAAGLTDHVWSLREVLLYRVPPWPQPVGV